MCHYYLCITKEHTTDLIKLGLNAFWVGSAFEDDSRPITRNPCAFVYVPSHNSVDEEEVLSLQEIHHLMKKNNCTEFYTSCTEDTDLARFSEEYNVLQSNRWIPKQHAEKAKFLYENAKVIYTDFNTTFCDTAIGYGIPVIGKIKHKYYTMYCDGNSKRRILYVLDRILELERFSPK